jgi:DNA-binding CsgD family transcriptional regulator
MSTIDNEAILRWLLSLYRAAQDTPLPEFKNQVFQRLKEIVPLASAAWTTTTATPDGGHCCAGIHLFQEPDTLADELVGMNVKYSEALETALASPLRAHNFYTSGRYPGHEHAAFRHYLWKYGHQNVLLLIDGPRTARKESFALYRSREDDHFTLNDQRLLQLLAPHMTEAFAINRQLAEKGTSETGSCLAGTRALIQTNGLMVTCGEQFLKLLRQHWPGWYSGRVPSELMRNLRLGTQTVATREGTIVLDTRKLGPYLFVQAGSPAGRALSGREAEIARLYALGRTYRQIADEIRLQPATVRNVLQKIYGKLQVNNKPQLVQALRAQRQVS